MLNIQVVLDDPEKVKQESEKKGYKVDIEKLLEVYQLRNKRLHVREDLKRKSNEISKKSKGPSEEAKKLKEELAIARQAFREADDEYIQRLKEVPNMPADDVPEGNSEADNVVVKEWGNKPKFDFAPKTHWEIAEQHDWIDKERAAKVAGTRFAYIKGDLVRLQFALVQFVLEALTNEETLKKIIQNSGLKNVSPKPFIPVLPPAMIRTEVFKNMDRLEPQDERYKVGSEEDDLWLQGSAEHTLGSMYTNEILSAEDLPIRYLGYLTSFRREAGSYGKDTEGIIRMHQFDKLEMESFTTPEQGLIEHLFFVAIQEYLMQQLNIPYHVLNKCKPDIGKPNARGIDIEAWLPSQNKYLETHTADYMTYYQARRLHTRIKNKDEHTVFAYTNDATALAPGRTMVAIIENYQQADGSVEIPEVLQKYMGGQTEI
ncbi:MAG TPA: serine--tRNA ligase [Candidatus Saccharimonadales bacterium]|nr:serine--tRNA ligase [Candidatus Saccharimonadales bacterium]